MIIFGQYLLNIFLVSSSLPPVLPSFLTCSSSEKFWNCLQDVWLEWRWRSRHGGVWTGKFSWKFPLNTLIFNTFSCALELLWSWSVYSDAIQFLKYQMYHFSELSPLLIGEVFLFVFTLNVRNYLSILLRSTLLWFPNIN